MNPSVLILVDRFDSLGGIQRWANDLSSAFTERDFATHLLGIRPPPDELRFPYNRPDSITTSYALANVDLARPGLAIRMQARLQRLPRSVGRQVERVLQGWRPIEENSHVSTHIAAHIEKIDGDVVVIATNQFMLRHALRAKTSLNDQSRCKIVAQYHNTFSFLEERPRALRSLRDDTDKASATVFLTDIDADGACAAGFNHTHSIPNPAPQPSYFVEPFNREKIIVGMGRLDHQKSYDYLVRAWGPIASHYPDWRVELWGAGPQAPVLERLIRRLGLSQSVRLMGPSHEPISRLSTASIHALTSQWEGWGLVISEANSTGTPTVSFNCAPGVSAQIKHGISGLLVPQNSIEMLTASLVTLMESEELRRDFGLHARKVAAQYSMGRVADQWVDLFNALVDSE